jgi:DNA mismatch repair ATPase MutS
MVQSDILLNSSVFANAVYTTIAALFVGTLVKLINKVVDRKKDNLAEHTILRKELREELDVVKRDLQRLQAELDEWKEKYYAQVQETNSLKLDVINLTEELIEYKRSNIDCV